MSPYRLATHLSTAFAIYAGILWTALSVSFPAAPLAAPSVSPASLLAALAARRRAHPLAGLIALTAASGAFVAGLDAGHAYNTFPLMGGRIIPEEYWAEGLPAWRNALENTAAVQFHHRVGATRHPLAGFTFDRGASGIGAVQRQHAIRSRFAGAGACELGSEIFLRF